MNDFAATVAALSTDAQTALISTGANRLGARCAGTDAALTELQRARLVGPVLGLTNRGVVARRLTLHARENAAF